VSNFSQIHFLSSLLHNNRIYLFNSPAWIATMSAFIAIGAGRSFPGHPFRHNREYRWDFGRFL